MKRLLVIPFLMWASSALAQPVNEHTIERPTYTVKGDGIAYNDGTWKESDATIDYSNPTKWENLETPTPWEINTSNLTLTMSRGSQASTIRPDGVYWLNTTTWDVTEAAGWAVPVVTENPTSVFLDGILNAGDGDAELISKKSGITWDYIFNDTTGWTANPYPVGESALVVRYQLGRNHTVTADGGAVDWGGTVASYVTFEAAGEKFDLATVSATDATGVENPITYYLRTAQGKDWFMEGIPAADFAAATLPLRYHYDTESGDMTADDTWTTGKTIYIASQFRTSTWTLTIEPGVVIKVNNNGNALKTTTSGDIQAVGTVGSPIYMTGCKDLTIGESGPENEATCGGVVGAGAWGPAFELTSSGTSVVKYVIIRYCGLSNNPVITDGRFGDVTMENIYIYDSTVESNYIYGNLGTNLPQRTFKHWYIHDGSTRISNPVFNMPNINDTTHVEEFTILNIGIVYDAIGTSDTVFYIKTGATGQLIFADNISVICTHGSAAAVGISWNGIGPGNNGHLRNSVVSGCGTGFDAPTLHRESHDYNVAYNNTTDFGAGWTQAAHEYTNSPGFTAEDHSSSVWFDSGTLDDYHVSGTYGEDFGVDTAASLGLDTGFHAVANATADSNGVDLGFHWWVDGGGGAPPVGGGGTPSGGSLQYNNRWGWGVIPWGRTRRW